MIDYILKIKIIMAIDCLFCDVRFEEIILHLPR
jgi:hypothetical protein